MTRKTPSAQYDLSIIIAAHREGLIAHKTMQSIERALIDLRRQGFSHEIIVTVDNGDDSTLDYFNSYTTSPITTYAINVADLAASRNYAVKKSSGRYIATVDADDLVSEHWFVNSLRLLKEESDDVVLHTQYSVNFGTKDIVWEKFDSRTKDEDAIIMTWANRWDSAVVAPRKVFEEFPYQPNTGGFGSEDWHFNSQTLAAGIKHKVVPETILFVRRKDISEMTIQAADRRTVHYTDLLSINTLRAIDTGPYRSAAMDTTIEPDRLINALSRAKHLSSRMAHYVHRKAKNLPVYKSITQPILSKRKQQKHEEINDRFPSWLVSEWRAIHTIDREIFPSRQLLNNIPIYHSEMYELGIAFRDIMASFSDKATYIMLIPALRPGGAEVVMLNFLNALRVIHPEWHLAVITTEANENKWRDRLSADIDFIDFGNITNGLSEDLRMQLLARVIVQSQASYIHIAQSILGFSFAKHYRSLLKNYTVYSFAFCEDEDDESRIAGHVHSGIPIAYPVISRVFSDHEAIINQLCSEYGFNKNLFTSLYQPVTIPTIEPHGAHKPLRILWASRIAKQKRPDILKEIAQQLNPNNIQIDVYGIFENGYDKDYFGTIASLTYKGSFTDVRQLNSDQYDVFLYTSENDGIPNILLEMISNGLLVIAPNIGGISELINEKTGILIEKNDDVKSYVQAINHLVSDYKSYLHRVTEAQKLIKKRHSFENLVKQLRDTLD